MAEESKKSNKKNLSKDKKKKETLEVEKTKKEVEKSKTIKEDKKDNSDSFVKKHLTDILLVVGAVVLIILGLFSFKGSGANYFNELTYQDYKDRVDSGEKFLVMIESATCTHCQNFMPVARKTANNYKVPFYYIDINELSEDEYNELLETNQFFLDNEDWGTPTTLVMTGNEVNDSLIGEADNDTLVEFFENNEFME